MNNSNNKSYPYKLVNVSSDGQLLTLWDGCNFVGLSVGDFMRGYDISVLAQLGQFADGTILMVDDGKFAVSPLSYDKDLDAVVSLKRLIADDLQLSTDTLELSQRVKLGVEGNIIKYTDEFDGGFSTPVITKYDRDNGTLGTFSRKIFPQVEIVIQPNDTQVYRQALYNPAPTTAATQSNVLGIQYKFLNAGLNIRVRGTVTTTEGIERNLNGTDANPYNYFVTTGGTQFVTFPGGIGNFPGYVYETFLEAYDPETNEATGEPLNMLGDIVNGQFQAYAKVFFQILEDEPFGTGGDVTGDGPAAIGDIPEYETVDGKKIKSSGFKADDFVKKTDPLNKQSINIIANTVDIYEPDDLYNHYFYIGAAPAAIKLKNPNDDYSEQDRFEVFNDSGYTLVMTDSNDIELQIIQSGQAYEFFYIDNDLFTGWKVETLRTRSRNVVEYDVSVDSAPTLGPADVGPLISIVQSGDITLPMVFSLEPFDNFQTGDVIEISASDSYTNYFFGVLYTSSIGQQLVVYPNNSCRLIRTETTWDVQQDGTFLRTGIRSSTSRNTPLEPDGSSMVPVNGISVIDTPDDIASYIKDADGHRVMQLDFTQVPTGDYVEKYSRADLNYVRVAYDGKYDDERNFYPASVQQDNNGWTKFNFTGYLQFRHIDKETGDINDTILTLQNGRAEFEKQPYYNGDKLATEPFVTDAIDSLLDVKTGDSANSNRLCKIPGYTNNYTSIIYDDGRIQGPRFGEGNGLFELIKYQHTKYGYLLLPVNNVSQVIGRDVDENDLELGINFTDDAKLIVGKYGQTLPTPNDFGVTAKIAFDYSVIAYEVDGANQDANNPTLYIKSNGDSTTDQTEAKVMGYSSNPAEIHKTFQGRDWGYSLIRGYIKNDKTFEADIDSPYYVASINTGIELTQDKQHTGGMHTGSLVIFNTALDASINKNPVARIDAVEQDIVESFEANNDLILAPNTGQEIYLKDSSKDLGYGLNNVSTYFQPADGPIDLDASTYLDYSQIYAVHKVTNSTKCLMMIHESLVAELWGQPVDDVNKLSMVIKSGAKAALGMVNKTAPAGGVWNYQGYAIDIATTSDNANTTNPTKYLKDDGTEATVVADYARAIYSAGTFKNDGTTLLARGVVNFTVDTATPNTFTADDLSDYFVCSVTIGGGTFNQFKMMPVFMTKTNNLDMYDKKAVLFDDAASAVGELLTICYDGAEEANTIAEAAKTSDSFGEFKQKIESATITETL